MKFCPRCGEVKPLEAFAKHSNRRDGRQVYCKTCRAEIDHARYERQVGRSVPRSFQQSERGRREWLNSLKEGRPCTDCGRIYPRQVMQWDHRPGFVKLGDISADFWGRSREEILAEIAKCDLVCTNCHIIRTFRRAEWGAKWLKDAVLEYEASWAAS